MTKYDDTTTLVSVTTSGASVAFTIDPSDHRRRLAFVVEQTAGSGTSHTVTVTTDPANAVAMKRVFSNSGSPDASPVAYDNHGLGYAWSPEDNGGKVSVFVTPNAGSDNNYRVRVYLI